MYWRKFEALYEAHSKRMAIQRVNELRTAMIAGVWGNSNYDDENDSRSKLLKEIDNFYNEAVNQIYNIPGEYQDEIDYENDPFFAAIKRPKLEVSTEGE